MTIKKENIYYSFNVHESFISAVSLLKDLMRILVVFFIFNCAIFKDLGSDWFCNNSISQKANQYLLI